MQKFRILFLISWQFYPIGVAKIKRSLTAYGKNRSDTGEPALFPWRQAFFWKQSICCKTLDGRLPPEDSSVRPQTLGKRVSDDPHHFIFRRGKHFFFCKTLSGRLPPEDSSDWPQTLGKRVSDDPQHFIFRRRTKKTVENFGAKINFFRVWESKGLWL